MKMTLRTSFLYCFWARLEIPESVRYPVTRVNTYAPRSNDCRLMVAFWIRSERNVLRALAPRIPGPGVSRVSKCKFQLTGLELDNGVVHLQKSPPLHKSSGSSLKSPRGNLLPDSQHQLLGHNTTPPGLNLDRGFAQAQIAIPLHSSFEILLDDGGEVIEAIKAPGFEVCKHTCSQEDFRQTNLVFVRIRERLFENCVTERLRVCSALGPLRGVHEHIITRRDVRSFSVSGQER